MSREDVHPLPAKDPIVGGPLIITELQGVESGVTLRGRFAVPRFARLNPEQARFLETFLRCRGMLNSVERELGISYPTARARLDAVLKALDLHAVREEANGASAAEAVPPEAEAPEATLDVAPSGYEPPDLPEWEPGEPEGGPSYEIPVEEATTTHEEVPVESPRDAEPETDPEAKDEPEAPAEPETPRLTRDEILSMLERGEIGVDEVKRELERAR